MGLFSRKFTSYLGVDIGASGIKVVELRNDHHRARLSTYGFSEVASTLFASAPEAHPPGAWSLGADRDATAATLRAIVGRAKGEATTAVAGLPIAAVFSSVITLPHMPAKEIPAAVRWEAKKLVPLPIEDMVVDWKELGSGVGSQGSGTGDQGPTPSSQPAPSRASGLPASNSRAMTRVLITAAPRALVDQYVAVFRTAGLTLVSLETEAFALMRSLVGTDPSAIALLDIGCVRSSLVIADQGAPVFSRSVEVGGQQFTRMIAEATGVDPAEAERMKLDLAMLPMSNGASALPAIIEQTLAPVIQEVRYGMNLYRSQEEHRGRVVEKLILAGGSALLPPIADILARALDLRVFVGDPWARVIYPVDLRPALDAIGPRFAVAIGLAMREVA